MGIITRIRDRRRHGERGAALVEFALLAPLLILLLIGLVEFGWLFGQFNSVRHAAREGARVAAVDAGQTGLSSTVVNTVTTSLEGLGAGLTNLEVKLCGASSSVGGPGSIGVTVDVSGLTNAPLISNFLPSQLSSTAQFRMEQVPNWSDIEPPGDPCP